VGVWSDRRRNFLFGLVFMVGASYGAPIVRSGLGLSAVETDLIQVSLIACALFFCYEECERPESIRGRCRRPIEGSMLWRAWL